MQLWLCCLLLTAEQRLDGLNRSAEVRSLKRVVIFSIIPVAIIAVFLAALLSTGKARATFLMSQGKNEKGTETMVHGQAAPSVSPYAVQGKQLSSLSEARTSYGFPLLLPADIPAGFQLTDIEHYRSAPNIPFTDLLMLRYASKDGHYLNIWQGTPIFVEHGAYDVMPASNKGAATVEGQPAFWMKGNLMKTSNPPPGQKVSTNNVTLKPGPLQLSWKLDPANEVRGYRLESDLLSLDQLVAIGDSVKP